MNPMHNPENYRATSGDVCRLGALFLMWLFDRLGCGICGDNPIPSRKLTTAVQTIDPSYCIDAPTSMPAGGMGNFSLPPDDEDDVETWWPEQLLCERE